MLKLKMYGLILLLFFMLSGTVYSEVKINNHPFDGREAIFFKSVEKGIYFGYHGRPDNVFYIKRIEDPAAEFPIAAENMRGTEFKMEMLDGSIFLVWRPKAFDGKKYVYVQRSDDGGKTFKEPKVLNATTDALPPIATATDGKDRLYVVWADERKGKNELYMNYTLNRGKEFLKEDIFLTQGMRGAGLSALLLKDNRVDFFFSGIREDEDIHFVGSSLWHKYSLDGGKTWSEPALIAKNTGWTPFVMNPFWVKGKMVVFWAGGEGIHGAYSNDGKTWQKVYFKETEGMKVSRLSIINKGEKLYMATSYGVAESAEEKPNIYFYKSEDGGLNWSGPRRLNTNKYGNTSSAYPDIAMGEDGKTLVVIWQDHRDIRGGIYMSYSRDGGKTWLKEDLPVEEKIGRHNNAYPWVVESEGKFYALWFRFADDRRQEGDMYLKELKID